MGLNIKNREVEELANELATLKGESKTEVIRQALLQEKAKMALPSVEQRWARLRERLERNVWSKLPPEVRGKGIPQAEQDEILGYGPDMVYGLAKTTGRPVLFTGDDFSKTDIGVA